MGKALYYGSYRSPRVLLWSIGVVIFLVMIITAFLGIKECPIWYNWSSTEKVLISDSSDCLVYSFIIPGSVMSDRLPGKKAFIQTASKACGDF